jgi:Secretion system C-terminal sorting domain/SprB repeat
MKKIILLFLLLSFCNLFSQITITFSYESNISCYNGNNGSIQINGFGGSGNYIYNLYPLLVTNQSGLFTGLGRGYYQCIVTDQNNSNLFATQDIFLLDPEAISANAIISNNNVTINASGGTPPYQFSINLFSYSNSNNFTFLQPGNYVATVKDSNDCTQNVSFTITNLDSEKFEFTNLKIFPNPTSGIFNFSNLELIDEINVFNFLGEIVFSKNVNAFTSQIDLSKVSKGIFFVKFLADNHQKTIKIIKN